MNLVKQAPIRVGYLKTGIDVDSLDLVSVAINFQRSSAIVHVVLRHAASGWTHPIDLANAEADEVWAAMKAEFPNFEKQVLTILAAKLPAGTIT